MGVGNIGELLQIPPRHDLFPIDYKDRKFSETIPDGFINPRQGFCVNDSDPDTVPVKAGQFSCE